MFARALLPKNVHTSFAWFVDNIGLFFEWRNFARKKKIKFF
jgi:hypothetical protein